MVRISETVLGLSFKIVLNPFHTMPRWLIHMKDGQTLTDADCFPHETTIMEKRGYAPKDITSVERIIGGKHLTIKKSQFIDTFFVATEEGLDMKMGSKHQAPAIVTKRIIGCYVSNTDPPLQVRLIMDPRTHNTRLKFMRVKKKTLVGINAKPVDPPPKGTLELEYTRELIGNTYSITQSPDVDSCFPRHNGLGCNLKNPKIRAEMIVQSQNVLLAFMGQNEKTKIIAPGQ